MPEDKPNELKLYVERESSGYDSHDEDAIQRLCSAFQDVTGYGLKFQLHLDGAVTKTDAGETIAIPLPDGRRETVPTLELATEPAESVEGSAGHRGASDDAFASCLNFAEAMSKVVSKLHTTRLALRDREGELAAAVPLVCDPAQDTRQIAGRLEATLKAGVTALKGTAAALFVLDDFTQHLKLRAHWGLSDDRFADPPRVLRTAKADLEALVGHAVVLDNPHAFGSWNAPHDFGSAICVPVSTATVPLGTMWFFDERPREYDDGEVGIVEVIAGRLAAELEREILLRSRIDGHATDEALVRDWTQLAWPVPPDQKGWQFSAGGGDDQTLPTSNWMYTQDGQVARIAMSSLSDRGIRGALLNAGLLAGTQLETLELSPSALARQMDSTVSQIAFENAPLSSWCAAINTDTGELEYCQTGCMEAFVIRPHAWEVLSGAKAKLAAIDAREYPEWQATLEPGDALLVIGGVRTEPSAREDGSSRGDDALSADVAPIDGPHLAEIALRHAHQTTDESLRLLRSLLNRHPHIWQQAPSLMLIYRE